MKQSCVSAFARLARSAGRTAVVAAVALVAGASALSAQSTGKIEGRVRDQAGAPIANAQVQVVGTAFNATTNPQGYYFINNVTAGTVALQANFIGFKGTRVEGIRVLSGQTITQDFALERSVVELQEVTVQTATVPLVPRDEVATKQRVDGEFVDKLPVDRVNQVLALQPGIVASASGNTISIRGGRSDEAATYIDGVPVQRGQRLLRVQGVGADVQSADPAQSISTVGLEEASVTTGASSAEFGNAQSGIINIATRTGSSTGYNGNVGFETDEIFSKTTSLGRNRVQLSFGGPAKIMPNLTFFVGGDLEGQKAADNSQLFGNATFGSEQSPLFVIPTDDDGRFITDTNLTAPDGSVVPVYAFAVHRGTCEEFANSTNAQIANNYGQDCQGIRSPFTSSSSYRVQGKLNYTFGSGSRVAFTTLMNNNQNRLAANVGTTDRSINTFVPENQFAQRSWSKYYILNWTQNLSKSAERAFALDASVSYQLDRYQRAPLAVNHSPGTLGFFVKPYEFRYGFNDLDLSDQLIENIRRNQGTRGIVDPTQFGQPEFEGQAADMRNPYGITDVFATGGFPEGRFQLYRENRWIGKGKVDWQADRYNRIQFGGEFTRYYNANYSYSLTSQAFNDAYIERPIRWNAFVEDRLDLGDVVLQLGARYDRYNTRASRPFFVCDESLATNGFCGDVALGDTTQAFRIVTNPQFNTENPSAIFRRDQAHGYISPHVQVSFPVTDKTNFRLSYAHQVQTPDFAIILAGLNTDVQYTNTNQLWGSDVDFGKTITYEFGIRHAFSDDMVLDFSAYNKDNLANATARKEIRFDPARGTNGGINVLQNADFGNTRGIDVRMDRRIGQFFNGTLAYSFTQAKSTGSDPFEYISTAGRNISALSATGFLAPPQAIAPVALSRPHSLTAAASLALPANWKEGSALGAVLGNFAVFSTLRVQSGTAYTLCVEEGNFNTRTGVQCEGAPRAGINTQRLPSFKSLDMRFTKGFGLGGTNVTAYLDARNILNFKNLVDVFVNTGDVVSQEDIEITQTNYRASIAQLGTPSGAYDAEEESLDLTFGGTGPQTQSCVGFATDDEPTASSIANCVYLIRAEQRYGNGDGIYTADEQNTAATAFYNINNGPQDFYGPGRRMRLGFELNF